MNTLRTFVVVACLAVAAFAYPGNHQPAQPIQPSRSNSVSNQLMPTQWLSPSELESLPPVDQITFEKLENMSPQEGAALIEKIYHLSQINQDVKPSYVPNPNNIPVYIMSPNGQNMSTNLNQLPSAAQQQPNFGNEEVTIFLTGYPPQTSTIRKATKKIVQAYMQHYNQQQQGPDMQSSPNGGRPNPNPNPNPNQNSNEPPTSSEENENENPWKQKPNTPTGNLIVVDLGSALNSFANIAHLDVEKTGAIIADKLLQMTQQNDVPEEIVHVVAQGPAAHVAGAAGRHYQQHTGHPLRRITGLDPSKLFARQPNTLTGLARGDAEFVDVIHTSTYGMGTPTRSGDVDFYPNGPSVAPPGSDNIVEATMRATRYFAESVQPGKEHNFPAVNANSLKQYKNNNGHGKRAYMGIATDFDLEGDYVLQVNPTSPFGQSSPAEPQNTYHAPRQGWRNRHGQDYD